MRHSQQQLRARIRRTIRARWNLNFAWRRLVPLASQPSATRECGRVLRAAGTAAVAASVRSDAVSISRGAGQGSMQLPQVQCR
jgi:hypothetical protein